jgi:hypothetical protein
LYGLSQAIEFSVLTLSQSQAVISKDDEQLGNAPADTTTTPKNAAASPDGPGSSSRRGLRTRTPAQQRPYFHNAQVFDELVSDGPEAETDSIPSPPKPKQKLKLTGLAQVSFPEVEEERQEQEEVTKLVGHDDDDELMLESEEPRPPRKAHYKGKGRAWKKTSDDEDEDYRSPVKVKSSQPTRKIGRRKSTQTAEDSAEDPESEESEKQQRHEEQQVHKKAEPVVQRPTPQPGKRPRKPRKISHLSEEFVKDDSDNALEERRALEAIAEPQKTQSINPTNPAQKTPKKRGRPRKYDQNTALEPKNEKITGSKDLVPAEKVPQALSLPKSAPPSRKKVTMAEHTILPQINMQKINKPEEDGRGRPGEFTTPGKTAPADPINLTVETPPRKKTPERSAEAISISNMDESDDSEPGVISEKTYTRRTERALASDLQALDDSGKAVTLPGPASSEAANPVPSHTTKPPSPPPESA